MIAPRNVELIVQDLSNLAPEEFRVALRGLSGMDRATLAQAALPTHEELAEHNADISNPLSPNYDIDLAN